MKLQKINTDKASTIAGVIVALSPLLMQYGVDHTVVDFIQATGIMVLGFVTNKS